MTGEQLYISHAADDLDLVQDLFSTVRNFPIGVHVALEEVESGRSRKRLEGRIANSNVVVAVLTETSADSRWVNQEIGYALAKGIPVLPLYTDAALRDGFLGDIDGVAIDRTDLTRTVFDLLCRLRRELAPLGALSVPNWYVQFSCTVASCTHPVVLELEDDQSKLWTLHEHGKLLSTACEGCGATYAFDPATVGYVRRERAAQ